MTMAMTSVLVICIESERPDEDGGQADGQRPLMSGNGGEQASEKNWVGEQAGEKNGVGGQRLLMLVVGGRGRNHY